MQRRQSVRKRHFAAATSQKNREKVLVWDIQPLLEVGTTTLPISIVVGMAWEGKAAKNQ